MSIGNTAKNVLLTTASDRRYAIAATVGVCMAVALFLLWFYHVEPVHGWLNGFIVAIRGLVVSTTESLRGIGQQALIYFNQNPVAAMTAGLASAGAIYGIISKIRADRAVTSTRMAAAQEISDAQKQVITVGQKVGIAEERIKSLEGELEGYKNDTSFQDAQKIITEQRERVTSLQAQVTELERVIEGLKLKEKVVTP